MDIAIDCDFPGGNIVVEGIKGEEVRVHQDLRDTARDWFYWCFRVRDVGGTALRVAFTRSRAIGVRGPAISLDGGETWSWLGAALAHGNTFVCDLPPGVPDVRLSFGMPYQLAHWQRFVRDLPAGGFFSLQTLCRSEKGRDVPVLLAGCLGSEPRIRAVITCRHHCCEMMADYVLEGLASWLLADADAAAQWLRTHVQFLMVPFVDLDGVEQGDQGKGRQPRDHGRDYEGESLFAATRSLRSLLPAWGAGRLLAAVDLHCPWIAGAHNEAIYLVGSPHERIAAEQRRFSALLEAAATGPLPFRQADFLPFGTAWNTPENYAGGKGFCRWAAELPDIALSTSIEVPYANAGGAEVNAASARGFGRDLGAALAAYLQALPAAEVEGKTG